MLKLLCLPLDIMYIHYEQGQIQPFDSKSNNTSKTSHRKFLIHCYFTRVSWYYLIFISSHRSHVYEVSAWILKGVPRYYNK
jgi:hypothetical protein